MTKAEAIAREEWRRAHVPLYNDQKLKLGVFGVNVSYGVNISHAPTTYKVTWEHTCEIVRRADAMGFELALPVARWRGFGGTTDFNGCSFETYTWAAGLAQATKNIMVAATSHVPTIHPIVAAKQATTIDHISGGRFALNVVCGWFVPELEMFGASIMEHERRYEYAAEWLEIVKRLWTSEDEFDYEGRFFRVKRGYQQPKPLQTPFPAVMNAGASSTGRRFAAQYADMVFTGLGRDGQGLKEDVDNYRRMAWEEFRREMQLWGHWVVICRPTEKEARDHLHYYVYDKGDWDAAGNVARILGLESGDDRGATYTPEQMRAIQARFITGWGGATLV